MIKRISNPISDFSCVRERIILNCCDYYFGYLDVVNDLYPHVRKEYFKLIKKNKQNLVDDVCSRLAFVPLDSWATIMCEPYKNIVEYDKDCKFVTNIFINNIQLFEANIKKVIHQAAVLGSDIAVSAEAYEKYNSILNSVFCEDSLVDLIVYAVE